MSETRDPFVGTSTGAGADATDGGSHGRNTAWAHVGRAGLGGAGTPMSGDTGLVHAAPTLHEWSGDDGRGISGTRRRAPRAEMTLNLTPMIDVVFQLLIFFLLTMSMGLDERVFAVDVPTSSAAAGMDDPFDLPDQPLTISVVSTGPSPSDYAIRFDLPGLEPPADFDELFRRLDAMQIRPGNPRGLFTPDNPIHIRPTPSTRWEHAVAALNACLRARYTNVQMIEPE